MTASDSIRRLTVFRRAADYFGQTYPLYERAGVRYPLVIFRPDPAQQDNVDSVLGVLSPEFEDPSAFAFRDDHHLQRLLNSGRRLENRPTFSLDRLEASPLKIHARMGVYFDMAATCDALEHEARAHFGAHPGMGDKTRLPLRSRLHQVVPPQESLTSGTGRSAAIGVATLTVFNHAGTYRAILARRSQRAATEPGAYHVLPAFVFQPMTSHPGEWSVRRHVYREYLEELCGMEEVVSPTSHDYFRPHPALELLQAMLADGRASLHLTGVSVNLLTLRPEICTLLLIHDPQWYTNSTVRTAWETERGSLVFAPIHADHALLGALPNGVGNALYASMTPQGSAALWLGVDRARAILGARGY